MVNAPPVALVIDDYEPFITTFQSLCDAHDIRVDTASSWQEGLETFKVGRHSLVASDYGLPGSELGFQLLSEVRRLVPTSRLILFSGFLTNDSIATMAPAGLVDRFLPKDADLGDRLIEEIQAAQVRSGSPTEWTETAAALRARAALDKRVVAEVDEALRRLAGPDL